ncbi:MAG: chromate efflux transporter [Geminicoccaceae bacterium]|nr:chromate efflux transporter [Geminicoccaceae bacterium]
MREVFLVFLKLGLTSFGGPVAHLGYFRDEFVARRKWLDEAAYADLVALGQFLPGPASSQVGLAIGLSRAGLTGGLAAWIGFTLPSALILLLFGYGVEAFGEAAGSGWLRGLKLVAVAIVANAVWGMATRLCPDRLRATFAVAATIFVLAVPGPLGQIGAIVIGGIAGRLLLSDTKPPPGDGVRIDIPLPLANGLLVLFVVLLGGLPLLAWMSDSHALALVDSFYRSGALVFGGGHVILPLLEAEVVEPGWIDRADFLAGYGAAQAIPGPLFTLSVYLGAMMDPEPNGLVGALICLIAIFLPSLLLVVGLLPRWATLRERPGVRSALGGVNAAVVGLLLAALYDPVWTSAVEGPADFALALSAFLLLVGWQVPPWLVVILAALAGALLLGVR